VLNTIKQSVRVAEKFRTIEDLSPYDSAMWKPKNLIKMYIKYENRSTKVLESARIRQFQVPIISSSNSLPRAKA
jgi:hypothetical protein